MGEMADAILNGDFDEITGEWLGPGDGYPRSLHYNRKPNASFGVKNYLSKKGFAKAEHHGIITIYTGEKDLNKACEAIQKNFSAFGQFIKQLSDE